VQLRCTVSSSEEVTGIAVGSTLVKVTTANGKTATCKITVR